MSEQGKPPGQQPMQIPVKASDDVQAGSFTNLARISHNPETFQVDFLTVHSHPPFAKLVSRLILTPAHAKRFLQALHENIQRYESAHGAIPTHEPPLPEGYIQ